MTYTVLGYCHDTGELGVAVATYSIAVGSLCPVAKTHTGALSSQAFVNPEMKSLGLSLLEQGFSAGQAVEILVRGDADKSFRQLGLLDRCGRAAVYTGSNNRGWAGHRTGDGYAAFGNVLAGGAVVDAMAEAFEHSDGNALSQRLIVALEAGRDAGGQMGAMGRLPERSAAILVCGRSEFDGVDLRVDLHSNAVDELRRVYDAAAPYAAFNRQRWLAPHEAVPQEAFAASLLSESIASPANGEQ